MASVFTHAAVPLLLGRVLRLPPSVSTRRLALCAAALAALPDLDLFAFVFDVRPWEPLGHRGLFHGLPFALLAASVVALMGFRGPAFGRVLALLAAAAASHGLLDALTRGDIGVALWAPFSSARILSPLRLVPVCPLGVSEYLGRLGAIVLANEALLVVAPLLLVTEVFRRLRDRLPFNALTGATTVWIAVVALLYVRWPAFYGLTRERVFRGYGPPESDDDLRWINPRPLPQQRLLTRFDDLAEYFGKPLEPERIPWSGGFFPAWYGGEAGRWSDPKVQLVARTLWGTQPLTPDVARRELDRDQAWGLAPTEKYDLAHADYSFAATRHSLGHTHNARPLPRFWFGLCNGVAAAAIERPEPFRVVDVESPDRHVVRFHPLDVKALLAESYYWEADTGVLGAPCEVIGFDSGRECSMNPGGLVIGTLNYLGRARRSFLVDVHPTRQDQYYAVASARVDVTRGRYRATGAEPLAEDLRGRVAELVDVGLDFRLSSTLLPDRVGDVAETSDATRYQRVGLRPVPFHWQATLALDAAGEIIGGRWRGDPADGPDAMAFLSGGPLLDAGMNLELHPHLHWPFIDLLARASVAESPAVPRLVLDGGAWELDLGTP